MKQHYKRILQTLKQLPGRLVRNIASNKWKIWAFISIYLLIIFVRTHAQKTTSPDLFLLVFLIMIYMLFLFSLRKKARKYYDPFTTVALTSLISALVFMLPFVFMAKFEMLMFQYAFAGALLPLLLVLAQFVWKITSGTISLYKRSIDFLWLRSPESRIHGDLPDAVKKKDAQKAQKAKKKKKRN